MNLGSAGKDGLLNLPALLQRLGQRGILQVWLCPSTVLFIRLMFPA